MLIATVIKEKTTIRLSITAGPFNALLRLGAAGHGLSIQKDHRNKSQNRNNLSNRNGTTRQTAKTGITVKVDQLRPAPSFAGYCADSFARNKPDHALHDASHH